MPQSISPKTLANTTQRNLPSETHDQCNGCRAVTGNGEIIDRLPYVDDARGANRARVYISKQNLNMPRSSLRRPGQDLDLSRHLIDTDNLPETLSSGSLFGNHLPLELEIGSGKGLFIDNAASMNPNHNYLGIEIIAKYAKHSAAKLARRQSTNAMMISGNAEPLLANLVSAESLEAVHVYFPDPWWKKRHRKRRVLNESSILNLTRCLRPGGRFHFWTDVLDYFENTVELIAEISPILGVPIPEDKIPATHDLDYRTHFERRSRQNLIPVYRVRYEKRDR
ncbi:tRNA (guanosine(46)-N7)-methyltransferase TrmB [Rhodopirellula sp.]|nr:tRNA (guanosine(46)-N7)-methyltransferase TrmB [Rhodopirellula sp.]